MNTEQTIGTLERDGFTFLAGVYAPGEVDAIRGALEEALIWKGTGVLGRDQSVYAARNVLTLWPPVRDVWRQAPLPDLLIDILGPQFGLVRVLYFDKPPGQSWALPWHKDLVIAVKDNSKPSRCFSHPTTKAGVPHFEAPQKVLERMLTVRIHLDDITEENGPLKAIPGSHRTGKKLVLGDDPPRTILAAKGDLLLIRPLVAHASNNALPDTHRHRRILHLEFAAEGELADGVQWHDFWPASAQESRSL